MRLVDVAKQHGDADKLHALLELTGQCAGLARPQHELLRALTFRAQRLLLALGQCKDIGAFKLRRIVELEQANGDRGGLPGSTGVLIGASDDVEGQYGRRRRRGAIRCEYREDPEESAARDHRSFSLSRVSLSACS